MDNFEPSSLIASVLTGLTPVAVVIGWFYRVVRKEQRQEALAISQKNIADFRKDEFSPELTRIDARLDMLEKHDAEFAVMKQKLDHVEDKVDQLVTSVKENAREAAQQLTGAMNRIAGQRNEDKEIQLERLDNLKELIEAQIKK